MEQSADTPETIDAAQLELTGENSSTRTFDPVAHDLDASFRLTRYTDLKG